MKTVAHFVPSMNFSMRHFASEAKHVMDKPCDSMREAIGILSTAIDDLEWFEFWMNSVEKMKRQGKL